MSEVFDGNVKWDWCNLNKDDLETELSNALTYCEDNVRTQEYINRKKKNSRKTLDKLDINGIEEEINKIQSYYDDSKEKQNTIYMGDICYYYQTSDFDSMVKKESEKFFSQIVEKHIDKIKEVTKKYRLLLCFNRGLRVSVARGV